MFRRIHWNNYGCKSIVWRCISRLEQTGHECHARTVNEQELEAIVVKALNELLSHREGYQNQLAQNIATVIRASAAASTDAIDEKLLALQQDNFFPRGCVWSSSHVPSAFGPPPSFLR